MAWHVAGRIARAGASKGNRNSLLQFVAKSVIIFLHDGLQPENREKREPTEILCGFSSWLEMVSLAGLLPFQPEPTKMKAHKGFCLQRNAMSRYQYQPNRSKNAQNRKRVEALVSRLPETIETMRDAFIALDVLQDYARLLDELEFDPIGSGVLVRVDQETGIRFESEDNFSLWVASVMEPEPNSGLQISGK